MSQPSNLTEKIFKMATNLVKTGWCQKAWAMNHEGRDVIPTDPSACQWCLTGALEKSLIDNGYDHRGGNDSYCEFQKIYGAMCAFLKHYNGIDGTLADWNDDDLREKDDVIAALTKALDHAKTGSIPVAVSRM